ncbi:MAG: hypothetical protein JST41_10840 [Bacteroidetes bacterium]|nr:hypothetical protein [Bacteroidota bacterium]MBX7129840.1 hypothetical protein [Flavobacteriales bacterium]MCC6654991.1 hypothetical protein [Flavobacteriales bacterium]HMU12983.1 hypothetical protein [Flavobacteriales bacterium]HMW96713.1 hypothetical protein [Flavobacteriales bacterium]
MHTLEPFYNWQHRYNAEEDDRSPFFGTEHSEFEFINSVYDHVIHPQWDEFGSRTLYLKTLFVDYEEGYAIIEMIGEWNDLLYNDVMLLKRDVIEPMMSHGIVRFILIGENVLNHHPSDEEYYSEWFEEVSDADGWIALLNFREHVRDDLKAANIDRYFLLGGQLDMMDWRTFEPEDLYERVSAQVMKRLGA